MRNPKSIKPASPCRRQVRQLPWLLLAAALLAGVTGTMAASGDAIEFYNEDLFFEKVNALSKVPLGATETEVIRAVGEPVAKTRLQDGTQVFVYRLRLYKGPGTFGSLPPQVYLTSETRVVFDQNGKVASLHREP